LEAWRENTSDPSDRTTPVAHLSVRDHSLPGERELWLFAVCA